MLSRWWRSGGGSGKYTEAKLEDIFSAKEEIAALKVTGVVTVDNGTKEVAVKEDLHAIQATATKAEVAATKAEVSAQEAKEAVDSLVAGDKQSLKLEWE